MYRATSTPVPADVQGLATVRMTTVGQKEPRSLYLEGLGVLQPYRKTKAGDVGGFTTPAPQKPRGKRKEPLHPCWLASFPPLLSLNKTNTEEDKHTALNPP